MLTEKELFLIAKKHNEMFKKLSEAKTREEKEAIYREAYPEFTDEGIEILLED
jgi:hypothetical protein